MLPQQELLLKEDRKRIIAQRKQLRTAKTGGPKYPATPIDGR